MPNRFTETIKNWLGWIGGHKKTVLQVVVGLFFILMGFYYIFHEKYEIDRLRIVLHNSHLKWMIPGILLTLAYILLQGSMYVYSFASIGKKIPFSRGTVLFLKRNLVSIFLPAGGVTSLAFFNADIITKDIQKPAIRAASAIYAVMGIVSVILIAIPICAVVIGRNYFGANEWIALLVISLLLCSLFYFFYLVSRKGGSYNWLVKKNPRIKDFLDTLTGNNIDRRYIILTLAISTLIEIVGILQVYVAMLAMNASPSLLLSVIAYFITVILLIVSPFLRGLGAIELSMVYVLGRFGYNPAQALSITLFYRFLEFWLPLLAGVLSFLIKLNQLLLRTLPAIFLFLMGVINILSVLTPPLHNRLRLVHHFFSIRTIWTSNYFVLMAGLLSIITAIFMWKGLRFAFYIAIGLCTVSVFGNLLKSFDYEEALVALFVLSFLLFSQKEYTVKRRKGISVKTSHFLLATTLIIILYGFAGTLFLHHYYSQWHVGFAEISSAVINNLLLLRSNTHLLQSNYSKYFFYSLNILGFLYFCLLLFLLIRPKYTKGLPETKNNANLARDMLFSMGRTANDYFKVYFDKSIFYLEGIEGFVSYKVFKSYAVVLEGPVVRHQEDLPKATFQFELFCRQNALKCFYYRVPEADLPYYMKGGKKKVLIGQEANLYLPDFTLNGKSKKAIRNGVNHATASGLKIKIYKPPVKDGLLQQLEAVSDDWLDYNDRQEIVFSQGMFKWSQLKNEVIFTVENDEDMVLAFLNWIPDFGRKTATYDLLRYTHEIPNGTVDFLLVSFFNYLKENSYEYVNLGFAPFAGIDEEDSKNFVEKSLSLTRKSIRSISEYQNGLRKSKDKFEPEWTNQYLIYQQDFDILQFRAVLKKVTQYKP